MITSSTRYAPVDGVATVARLPSFQNGLIYCFDRVFFFFADADLLMPASLYFIQNGILPPFMEAIFTPVDQTYAHLAATCSTGNCQWLPFNSLAICASMNDVTDQLNVSAVQSPNATLPNGHSLDTPPLPWLINITARPSYLMLDYPSTSQTLSFSNQIDLLQTELIDVSIIYVDNSSESITFAVVEILFHFCVESYKIDTVNGTTYTNRTSSSTDVVFVANSEETVALAGPGDRHNYTACWLCTLLFVIRSCPFSLASMYWTSRPWVMGLPPLAWPWGWLSICHHHKAGIPGMAERIRCVKPSWV